ncbi:L,D-transpeptidase family protein [Sphingomonas sinipercae]|uniref:L,D-transpeptidase family protein n=1 Tax=Sphingomonas sinipercae TaxID=2714944 RepID=A0A6G7ZPV9_9SPHN|nr:L,D-transpeptidase family protein [Sphingomonas sinipercae]QIL02968.1 L,D-transpeptidase family protein [Sphingomonas sinipercae]
MTSKRNMRTGFVPVRNLSRLSGVVAALLATAPFGLASTPAFAAQPAQAQPADASINEFYAARAGAPVWTESGRPNAAGQALLGLLASAQADGLNPARYRSPALAGALQAAQSPKRKVAARAARDAELLLSRAYVDYARDLRAAPAAGMEFFDPSLRPVAPPARTLLSMAAAAPSLPTFIREMRWMNPAYAQLRQALIANADPDKREMLQLNLARARVLPGRTDRFVVVNAAAQRLDMFDGGKLVDSMRVVVGKQKDNSRTPMLASSIRLANLNPYWNVPPDLAAERIAPFVVKSGAKYLKQHHYEVLSDWSPDASPVDPATIDWQGVADGKVEVRVRQLPFRGNSLGKVKFNFPNPYGVYLHDTPDKQLLTEDTRLFSGGCIRLEDAARFGEWLFGHELTTASSDPELPVPLDRPVPVYVTYMTAEPTGSTITYFNDVYGWDAERLAQIHGGGVRAGN